MTQIKERNLVEVPVLFVQDHNGNTYPYTRIYTNQAFPVYIPPPEKNVFEGMTIDEIIFIPITPDEFKNNKEDYFFGMRYLFSYNTHMTVSFMNNPSQDGITTLQLQHEVSRFRYYPEGEKTIIIDKQYDCLYPTANMGLNAHTSQVNVELIKMMNTLVDQYCAFYIDKKI